MRYEDTPLRQITGNFLRPGGADLTCYGLRLCDFPQKARLLDVGCGAGATLNLVSDLGFEAYGLDISSPLLDEAKKRAPVVLADMERLPFADAVFDGIACECVLSLSRSAAIVLDEFCRILKRGGRLLFSDLTLRNEACITNNLGLQAISANGCTIPCARGALTMAGWKALLESVGMHVLHTEDKTAALRDLTAKIVWTFGSIAAFSELWHNQNDTSSATLSTGRNVELPLGGPVQKRFGYTLIIAEYRRGR